MLKFKTKTMESFELSIDGSVFSSSEIYKAITKGSANRLLTAIYQVTVTYFSHFNIVLDLVWD